MATKIKRSRATKKVTKAVQKLSPEEAAEVTMAAAEVAAKKADEAAVVIEANQGERLPGQVDDSGHKIQWTLSEYDKRFPLVTFTPETTMKLTLNGVVKQMLANVECIVPEPFYSEYRRIMKQRAIPPKLPNLGFTNEVLVGAGALPPENITTRE